MAKQKDKQIDILEESGQVYPDLTLAINKLEIRAGEVSNERRPLVEKWVKQLQQIQKEINHFKRIEEFTSALETVGGNDERAK
tara:strand:- start:184 stop:432 length:249 start_codon:yes stop_codon:yes gene_type:complete